MKQLVKTDMVTPLAGQDTANSAEFGVALLSY